MANRFSLVPLSLILGLFSPGSINQASAAGPPPKAVAVAPEVPGAPGQAASKPAPAVPANAPGAASANAPSGKAGPVAIDRSAQTLIFCYHRFVDKVRFPGTEIKPADFEAQMKLLKDSGIAVIGMQDFLAWKRGEKNIPPRCAIITFDDGWETQYKVAWPILKKYGYPLTLFLYTEGVRGGTLGGGGAITWEQLAEMRDEGVDIQAHSATHQDLREGHAVTVAVPGAKRIRKKLTGTEYQEWLHNEVVGCKELLERKLAIKVNCYAVPFGKYNDHVKQLAHDTGYEALFTVYGQPLTLNSPADALGRYAIEADKPKVFAEAVKLIAASGGGATPVADIAPLNLATQPADGDTIRTALPLIKATLSGLGEVDPDTVQMRVSGLGLVTTSYDPKTDSVSYQVTEPLADKTCTVILSAKAGDKKVEVHWTFRIDKSGAPAAAPAPGKK